MKVFGISLWTIAILIAAMWFGSRYPNVVNKIPLVGKVGPLA